MVLHFQVLGCTRAWVAEEFAGHDDGTVGRVAASILHQEEGSEGHAVDGQVQLATGVADGQGEAAVVGADQMNALASITGEI